MYNPFWEQQQKFFKTWTDTVGGMKVPGMEGFEKMYQNMMPNFEEWTKVVGSVTPGLDSFAKLYGAKMPGFDLYNKVFEFWKGMENPAEFMKNYGERYSELMQEFFQSVLPQDSVQFFTKPQELLDTCVNFYQNVMSPWMEIDPAILERIAQGDRQAYLDFFHEVNGKYEESFGKVFNMMGLGLNRETYEEQMKAIGSYYKVLFAAGELTALIMNTAADAMKTLLEEYQKMLKEGKGVTTFREFYKLWYQVNEDALLKLFNTDAFSRLFATFSDQYSRYVINMNAVYEQVLAPLPIPTKKDMDSLYKTVYLLRKDVRDLRQEIGALRGQLETSKKA